MTKEQLWEIIQDLDDRLSKLEGFLVEERLEAIMAARDTLEAMTPDAETGLVPCGCGGRASIEHWREDSMLVEGEWNVICEQCRLMFVDNFATEQGARDAWNRARGYKNT